MGGLDQSMASSKELGVDTSTQPGVRADRILVAFFLTLLCALFSSLDLLMVPVALRSAAAAEHPQAGAWVALTYSAVGSMLMIAIRVAAAVSRDSGWRHLEASAVSEDEAHRAAKAEVQQSLLLFWRSPQERLLWLLRGVNGGAAWVATCLALGSMPLQDATAIVYAQVAPSAIAAYFVLGERLHPEHALAIVLCIVGATLITQPGYIFGQRALQTPHYWVGAASAIAATFLLSLAYVLVRKMQRDLGTSAFTTTASLVFTMLPLSAIVCLLDWLTTGFVLDVTSAKTVACLVCGAVCTTGSIISLSLALRFTSVVAVMSLRLAGTLCLSAFWQVTLLDQPTSVLAAVGAASILAGSLVATISRHVRQRVAPSADS